MCRITAAPSPLIAMTVTDRTMSSDASHIKVGRFLTVAEAADELCISPKHLRRAIDRGDLPTHRFGRAVRIARTDLEQFINCHRS
jgi:excisionase family DNA binding protein